MSAKPHMVGYARVSTDDQDLSLQLDALVRYGVDPHDIHTDKASGASEDRPGFIAMWKDLRCGDVLVVWKLDRLGRQLSRLIQTADRIKAKGCQFVSLTEAIDTTSPAGILMFHMISAFAEFERNMIVQRTMAGLQAARERGRVGGRRAVLTDVLIDRAEDLVRDVAEGGEGLSVRDAARLIGVAPATLYKAFRKRNELAAEERGADDLAA